jgi:hypothetical protein
MTPEEREDWILEGSEDPENSEGSEDPEGSEDSENNSTNEGGSHA